LHLHLAAASSSSFDLFAEDLLPLVTTTPERRPSRARIEETLLVEQEHEWNILDGRGWEQDLDLEVAPTNNFGFDGKDADALPNKLKNTKKQLTSAVSLHLSAAETTTAMTDSSNNFLSKKFKKTGTTIAGCCIDNHVILAADTRATEGSMVADKQCQKLHQLAQNSWCCGAGTSADLDHLTKHCLYSMALQRLQHTTVGNEGSMDPLLCGPQTDQHDDDDDDDESSHHLLIGPVSTDALCHFLREALYDAKGQLGANLILGGVWQGKAHLRAIHPHGSMDVDLPFAALGSGGLAAMGVLERGYRSTNMSLEEGIELVQNAILAGIQNDLGSGSQVDLCVIAPDGTSRFQRCVVPEEELDDDDDEGLLRSGEPSSARTTTIEGENLGVNGFGNLPFAVQSTKVHLVSTEAKQRECLTQWDEVLGVSKKVENNDDKS
jgi:20S proteasome subunit beta 2